MTSSMDRISRDDELLDALGNRRRLSGEEPVIALLGAWAAEIDTTPVVSRSATRRSRGRARGLGILSTALVTFTGGSVAAAMTGVELPVLSQVGQVLVGWAPGVPEVMGHVEEIPAPSVAGLAMQPTDLPPAQQSPATKDEPIALETDRPTALETAGIAREIVAPGRSSTPLRVQVAAAARPALDMVEGLGGAITSPPGQDVTPPRTGLPSAPPSIAPGQDKAPGRTSPPPATPSNPPIQDVARGETYPPSATPSTPASAPPSTPASATPGQDKAPGGTSPPSATPSTPASAPPGQDKAPGGTSPPSATPPTPPPASTGQPSATPSTPPGQPKNPGAGGASATGPALTTEDGPASTTETAPQPVADR